MKTIERLITSEKFLEFKNKVRLHEYTNYHSMYKDLKCNIKYTRDNFDTKDLVYVVFDYTPYSSFGLMFLSKHFLSFDYNDICNIYIYGIIANRYHLMSIKNISYTISIADQKFINMFNKKYMGLSIYEE